ncbi:MAG: phosphodiester glycosidase family protein [Pseudomonadota bacterium]
MKTKRFSTLILFAFFGGPLAAPGPAAAAEAGGSSTVCKSGLERKAEPIVDGIELIEESCADPLYHAFLARVGLASDRYEVITTPAKMIYTEVDKFGEKTGSIVATNGGFYGPKHGGWFMSFGQEKGSFVDNEHTSVVAFGKNDKGGIRSKLFPPGHVMPKGGGAPDWIVHGLTGIPVLLHEGKILTTYPPDDLELFKKGQSPDSKEASDMWKKRNPRTGVGFSKDGAWMMMVVVDGRQKDWSMGMSVKSFAQLLKDHDAWNALNLDGGCSSAMYVGKKGGFVSSPCMPKGKLRNVATHLAVVPVKKDKSASSVLRLLALLNPLRHLAGRLMKFSFIT